MNRLLYLFLFVFLFSCSGKNRFPEPVSEKVSPEQVTLLERLKLSNRDSSSNSIQNVDGNAYLSELNHFQDLYFKKDSEFDLENFENEWEEVSADINHSKLSLPEAKSWFEITGTLMQITGEAKYAGEMQQSILHGFAPENEAEYNEIEELVAPYIFTKNVDHIHVNLYTAAEIEYEHTMHGNVKIWQETDYPDSEDVTINFSLEKENYIEVALRIPDWAEGATITVIGVKYPAHPGDYTVIAKKWHEGDKIEIRFPKSQTMAGL